ncbi:hypothetical protein Tco_0803180 [Tanacetum coccineum]|uniref:Uncharacterized protein n=1 Tax=Tanacetum coccineum TaxID=301880 RepID=A0ABQ5A1S7_9ASTR
MGKKHKLIVAIGTLGPSLWRLHLVESKGYEHAGSSMSRPKNCLLWTRLIKPLLSSKLFATISGIRLASRTPRWVLGELIIVRSVLVSAIGSREDFLEMGLGLSGERLGSLKECTRRGWEELETMGRGGMVLAPRGIEYRVWSGFGLAMAEIGCNWARIGPSKSSQSLSNAHKWAAVID